MKVVGRIHPGENGMWLLDVGENRHCRHTVGECVHAFGEYYAIGKPQTITVVTDEPVVPETTPEGTPQ